MKTFKSIITVLVFAFSLAAIAQNDSVVARSFGNSKLTFHQVYGVVRVDYRGNKIEEVIKVWPIESRYKPGFTFFNEEGKITLIKYEEVTKGFYRWKCKLQRYNYGTGPDIVTTCYIPEFEVNESVGVWVHDPISGKTYEYVTELKNTIRNE